MVRDKLSSTVDKLSAGADAVAEQFGQRTNQLRRAAGEAGEEFVDRAGDLRRGAVQTSQRVARQGAQQVQRNVRRVSRKAARAGTTAQEATVEGIERSADAVQSAGRTATDATVGAAQRATRPVRNLPKSAVQAKLQAKDTTQSLGSTIKEQAGAASNAAVETAARAEERLAERPAGQAFGAGASTIIESIDEGTEPGRDLAGEKFSPIADASSQARSAILENASAERSADLRTLGNPTTLVTSGEPEPSPVDRAGVGAAESAASVAGLGATAAGAAQAGEAGLRFAGNQIQDQGVVRGSATTASAAGAAGVAVGASAIKTAQQRPFRTAGGLAFDTVAGTAAARGLERGLRSVRARRAADRDAPTVEFDEITDEQGRQGGLPKFETSPEAPAPAAARELADKSRAAPDDIQQEIGSENLLFRSETERFGSEPELGAGGYELEGAFGSPRASPINLDSVNQRRGGYRIGLPSLKAQPERLSTFETKGFRAMPRRAAESGKKRDPDTGERIPDPDTAGSRFLREEAEPGVGFARATTDRSTELEGVIPPGTRFERVSTGRVDVQGTPGTMDLFRLADDQPSRGGRASPDIEADTPDAETLTFEEISDRARQRTSSRTAPGNDPITPSPIPGGSSPAAATSQTVGISQRTTSPNSLSASGSASADAPGLSAAESVETSISQSRGASAAGGSITDPSASRRTPSESSTDFSSIGLDGASSVASSVQSSSNAVVSSPIVSTSSGSGALSTSVGSGGGGVAGPPTSIGGSLVSSGSGARPRFPFDADKEPERRPLVPIGEADTPFKNPVVGGTEAFSLLDPTPEDSPFAIDSSSRRI